MRNLTPARVKQYGWDQFCADPAGFVDTCLADDWCKK